MHPYFQYLFWAEFFWGIVVVMDWINKGEPTQPGWQWQGALLIFLGVSVLYLAIARLIDGVDDALDRAETRQRRARQNQFEPEPQMEYVIGEPVDEGHIPLYARNSTNSPRLPGPARGGLGSFEYCRGCRAETPHVLASIGDHSNTYRCLKCGRES